MMFRTHTPQDMGLPAFRGPQDMVVTRRAGVGELEECFQRPAPNYCFTADGVARITANGNAQQAEWENDRNRAIYEEAQRQWEINGRRGPAPNAPQYLSEDPAAYLAASRTGSANGWVLADGSVTTTDPTGSGPIYAGATFDDWTSSAARLLPNGTYETAAQVTARLALQRAAATPAAPPAAPPAPGAPPAPPTPPKTPTSPQTTKQAIEKLQDELKANPAIAVGLAVLLFMAVKGGR